MKFEIQTLKAKDIPSVSKLIDHAFLESVASTLTDEGIHNFKIGTTPESIKKRFLSGNTFIICKHKNNVVGVGEIRNNNHLNLFFVEPSLQRKGIGKKIFNRLLMAVIENEITVNASLNAVNAYTKLGFIISSSANIIREIKYQPMVYKINKQ